MEGGRKNGLAAGLGSATADTFFATIACIGVFHIEEWLNKYNLCVQCISIVVLLILSIKVLKNSSNLESKKEPKAHHEFFSTFLMAIVNPPTIFVFMLIFSIFQITAQPLNKVVEIPVVIGGIMVGSFAWWIAIVAIVEKYKNLVSDRFQIIVKKVSGFLLLAMAFGVVINVIRDYLLK